jgi:HK97 family phage portal protein
LHKGVAKSHELGILEGGAKWKSVGIPPEDAQLLLTRRFSVSEVARMFGLPPHLLADVEKSTSWGTGIEQQNIGLVVYTLGPWFARFEQRITRELTGAGIFAEYDVNGLLRGDMKTRFSSYAQGIQWGWLSRDEVRGYENLEPIPDGEGSKFLVPSNMQVVDEENEPDETDEPEAEPIDEETDDNEND